MRTDIAKLVLFAGLLALWPAAAPAQPQAPERLSPAGVATPNARPARPAVTSPIPNTMGWQDELVDKLGDVGTASSLALDASGMPHIAYYDLTNGILKYAAWDGVAWAVDVVERNLGDLTHFRISYPIRSGIAVYGGTVYIVYEKRDAATGVTFVQYAVGGPGNWRITTIAPSDGLTKAYAPTLRLDKQAIPRVSYSLSERYGLFPSQTIVYAHLDVNDTWVAQTVDTLANNWRSGAVTSLALDQNDQPQIAYATPYIDVFSTNESQLRWAGWNGSAWLTETVDITGSLPSLAVDSAGAPHIAYVTEDSSSPAQVRYAQRSGAAWQISSLCACVNSYPALALDAFDQPHIATDGAGLKLIRWTGSAWITDTVPATAVTPSQPSLALDAAGQAHLSYSDGGYQDLHVLTWASNWQTRTVALIGDVARLAVDLHGLPYVSYATNPLLTYAHVQLANWIPGGNWLIRSALPFSAADHSMRLQYDINQQPVPTFSYTDEEFPGQHHLGFAKWDGATFVTQTVDGGLDAGYNSSLAFGSGAAPIIGYTNYDNQNNLLLKLAWSPDGGQTWTTTTDTAAPALGPASAVQSLSAGGSDTSANAYIAYYESTSQALRLATWNGASWTDEKVDGGLGDAAGSFVSLAVDRATGRPAMAYLASTGGDIRYAFWGGSGWVTATVDSGVQSVSDLSLSLALASDQYPRIAYTAKVDRSLRLAWTSAPTDTWTIETVAAFSADPTATIPPVRLSSQAQARDHIAFSHPAMGVVYAFRSATLPYALFYNPLQPCVDNPPNLAASGKTLARVRALAPADLGQVDDLTTLRALRDLFALSPGGQYYINLYYQYAPETGALALADPSLLWDAYRTLQNFLPGALALASGQGSQIVITQAMVDQANNIADRLAAAGSPALGAAINLERGKYNHLQDFVGVTFDDAAQRLGVASHAFFLPLVRR